MSARDTLLNTAIVAGWTLAQILDTEADNLVKIWEDCIRDDVEYGGGIYIRVGADRPTVNSAKGNDNNMNIERFRTPPPGSQILAEFHTHNGKQPRDGRPSNEDISNHWDRTFKNPAATHVALVVTTTKEPAGGWGKYAAVTKEYAVIVREDAAKGARIWAMPRLTEKPNFD